MRINLIREEQKPKRQILKNLFSKRHLLLLGAFLVVFFVLIPAFTYVYFAKDLKDKNSIMNRNNNGVQLLDDQGEVFFTFYNPKTVEFVPLSQIPENLQHAVIVSEDRDFYTNPGFSARGIGRAFINNLTSGSIKQGGSTITQQLVKNALLSPRRTLLRKYQELILALEINRRYEKEDILEMYLNSVYFGEGAFGAENAAETYFNKNAKDLNLSESALLAAILPAPSRFSPLSGDIEAAMKRQEVILLEMEKAGYITPAQKQAALTAKVNLVEPEKDAINTLAPHFAIMVKDQLIEKYGEENVIRSGYRVKTTLNRKWQEYAQTTVQNQVARLRVNRATNAAAVVIDPKTGQVKALVGSYDWTNEEFGKFNIVTAKRQPGSAFKPIIYAKAFEDRTITPASIIDDTKTTFQRNYTPQNFDKKFRGPVTVRRSLASSLNVPSVKIMEKVGVENGLQAAKKLGINSLGKPQDYGLSLVLGGGEVQLLELTSAYAVFANAGTYNPPAFILEIEDKKNEIIFEFSQDSRRVIGDGVAFLISSILSDTSARQEVFGNALNTARQAAVKTGTTENFKDALTLGYLPNIAIGVWVGNNDGRPMDNVAGSLGAAPIWTALMNRFSQDLPTEGFVQPSSVVARQACAPAPTASPSPDPSPQPSSRSEFFLRGTEPEECKLPSPTPVPSPSSSPQQQVSPSPESSPPAPASPTPPATPSPPVVETPIPPFIIIPTFP